MDRNKQSNRTNRSRIAVKATISEDLSGKEDHNVAKLQYLQKRNEKLNGVHTRHEISLRSRSRQRNHRLNLNTGAGDLSDLGLMQSRQSSVDGQQPSNQHEKRPQIPTNLLPRLNEHAAQFTPEELKALALLNNEYQEHRALSQRTPRLVTRSHISRTVLHGQHQVASMLSGVYDSDDALNRSPVLQPSAVKYGPDDSIPPPFLQEKQQRASANSKGDSSSSPTSSEGRSPMRRLHRKPKRSLADVVLLGTLAPDRQDLARQIGEGSPPVDSESEDDSRTRVAHISSKSNEIQVVAANALDLMTEEPKPSLPSFQDLVSQDRIFAESPFLVRQTSLLRSLKPLGRPRQDSLAASGG
jgi:hypothetical protein